MNVLEYKKQYYYEHSLIPKNRQEKEKLFLDTTLIDKEVFDELKLVKDNIVENVDKGKNYYLYSAIAGNGKTAWALNLMKEYIDNVYQIKNLRPIAIFISVPTYFSRLRLSMEKSDEYIDFIRDNILKSDLVIWDDVATKSATDWEKENLFILIDNRLNLGLSNIYTSNILPDELEQLVGARLYSRIINTSELFEFKGSDKRGLLSDSKSSN